MRINPFDVTKAVDLTDDEIESTFVTYSAADGSGIVDPQSRVPRYLLGAKGGGRTHYMRHLAFPVADLRSPNGIARAQREKFIGVYIRCSGLNGRRFQKKGYAEDVWSDVFAYYMDLWLTKALVEIVTAIARASDDHSASAAAERFDSAVIEAVLNGHEADQLDRGMSSSSFIAHVLARMDRAINNASLRGNLDSVQILTSPGSIIFDVANMVGSEMPKFSDIMLTFLLDEFENFSAPQQAYVNTLLREKVMPVNFIIGGRTSGIRTHETLGSGEVNKRGSEYTEVVLEEYYSTSEKSYADFCENIVVQRVRRTAVRDFTAADLSVVCSSSSDNWFSDLEAKKIVNDFAPLRRPHLMRLRENLSLIRHVDVDGVIDAVRNEDHPLVEKYLVFKLYQEWASRHSVDAESLNIIKEYSESLTRHGKASSVGENFKTWRYDLLAQMRREARLPQKYEGFSEFVQMSGFLPRSLLIILKSVTEWSMFYGEDPWYRREELSQIAQSRGVRDAAEWFATDSLPAGRLGNQMDIAVRRLGNLLRGLRFCDKPSEVSPSTFSTNFQGVSDPAVLLLQNCVDHGLIIERSSGRKERNSGVPHRMFQLNPMLCPLYALPTARRGVHSLVALEVTAVFDPSVEDGVYSQVVKQRLTHLSAPFGFGAKQNEVLF